jgi:uncharacterized protein YggE
MKVLLLLALLAVSFAQNGCCDNNIVSIAGAGRVSVDPDIGQFTVSANAFGKTSAIALSKVNGIIAQVSAILTARGLPSANFTTQGLNLSPQYNYTDSGVAILIGQQAYLSLSVTLGNLNVNKQLVGQIFSALSAVNNISLSSLTFSNSNTDIAYRLARRAAVSDAVAKAKQYSTLACKKLGNVKKIIDQNIEYYTPYYSDFSLYSFKAQSLQVPYGQVSISASVQINWNLLN